ncbi:MAG: type II toxin-antitoxin system RelB/DinJ family antitoxin [Propionibacteriaceae bacterium]|jgi:DNA-damage-inducible protein J|nr:type II toxin-antitoxin system RelB/DinJ family antitoxin [Propionibacteriaceae bacterium]
MTSIVRDSLVQVRVDRETKRNADALFTDLGLDTPTAIRVFLRQAIEGRGFPFEIRQQPRYNPTTEAAIAEGDAIAEGRLEAPAYRSWSDFEASLSDD